MTETVKEMDRRISDGYFFSTREESELIREVGEMEDRSRWIMNVRTSDLALSAIDGPIHAAEALARFGLPADEALDTAAAGSRLVLHDSSGPGTDHYLVRGSAVPSICREAKLEGSALGKMDRATFARVMNEALKVASGRTLMLERFGKISALLSEQYEIMPVSELLRISREALTDRFGEIEFMGGTNEHEYTSAVWELPEAQNDLLCRYQEALRKHAVSRCVPADFMPAVKFGSSDTGGSSAFLIPVFKLRSGTYFRLSRGVEVRHRRSSRGIGRFRREAGELYARFGDCIEKVEKLAKTEVWNPANAVVSICNRFGICKKYGARALELVERFSAGSPCLSAHDVYLCICEVVGCAERAGAARSYLLNLEETVARIVSCDWSEHDVPGTVAWKSAALPKGC